MIRIGFFALLMLCANLFVAQAQPELDNTFVTSDGSFQFRYPAGWSINARDDGTLTAGDDAGDSPYSLWIIPPAALDQFGSGIAKAKTADAILAVLMEATSGAFEYGTPGKVTLPSGIAGVRVSVASEAPSVAEASDVFALALPVGDTFAVIFGIGSEDAEVNELEAFVYAVADTFEAGEFEQPGTVTGDLPTLRHFGEGDMGSSWEPAVEELETLELIPAGGELIYSEDIVFPGLAPRFQLSHESDYTNFAMGALISFRAVEAGDTGVCGLLTRATTTPDDAPISFLAVGATSSNTVIVIEKGAASDEPFIYETGVITDFDQPQHLLYIVQDSKVTVFLNGEAIIEDLPLQFPPDGEELLLVGRNLDRGCVMTGVWAYGIPSDATED